MAAEARSRKVCPIQQQAWRPAPVLVLAQAVCQGEQTGRLGHEVI